jgi:hydroxymethylglutaryl-CoA reductase
MPSRDGKTFWKLTLGERHEKLLHEVPGLTMQDLEPILRGCVRYSKEDVPFQNTIGRYSALRYDGARNFLINGKEFPFVPMVLEEPSVAAAASNAAKLARRHGGFASEASEPISSGHIPLRGVPDHEAAIRKIMKHKTRLIEIANAAEPTLARKGGGLKDVEAEPVITSRGPLLKVRLLVNCGDIQGSNAINTIAEALYPEVERITGGEKIAAIVSNYNSRRIVRASALFDKNDIAVTGFSPEKTVRNILDLVAFGKRDIERAATDTKGIMNGVDSLALATAQDWRAQEAGVHTYAMRSGRYQTLADYAEDRDGNLVGGIEIPISVGVFGRLLNSNPEAQLSFKLLGVQGSAAKLAEVFGALALAQNFAALREVSTEGIQKGHMRLQAEVIEKSTE